MNRNVVQDIVQPISMTLGQDKTRISLALAISLGYLLPMPTERKRDPAVFFETNYGQHVRKFVSDINERVLIETNTVVDNTKAFFLFRYNSMYATDPKTIIDQMKSSCPICDTLQQYSLGEEESQQVIMVGIASIDRIERVFMEEVRSVATNV